MKFLLFIIGMLLYFYFSYANAAPASITIEQYGFGLGFWHGFTWWCLWIQQLFGRNIFIIAENHTTMYMVGFVLGCVLSVMPIMFTYDFIRIFIFKER